MILKIDKFISKWYLDIIFGDDRILYLWIYCIVKCFVEF